MTTATKDQETTPSYAGADAPAAGQATGLLIIGASQSGVQLAASLRALGFDEHITLLGDEDHRPYQRPALSKEWLQGKVGNESLIFRTNDYWVDHNVTLVKNERIDDIQRDKQDPEAGIAYGRSGATYPYRRLALMVGASPRRLDVQGGNLPGVVYLRNADDAIELKALVPEAKDVVVVGGGFIGLEAAASLHELGKNVTVLEHGPKLIGRAVGEQTSEYFLKEHLDRGLDIRLEAQIDEILPDENGDVKAVRLTDGEEVAAQIVLIGIGVVPNTQLAEVLGLEVNNGIVVNAHALASDGTTIVAGDVANMPNPVPGSPDDERIRMESVNNAIEHAKVAAYSLMGRSEEYAGIPWFWSNQADIKLQIAGLSTGFDQTVVRDATERGKFSVLYYRNGQIIAADCANAPLDFMAVKQALGKGKNISPDAAADVSTMLKSLIA
ncbi:MAG: FAD-dependent oxidoreductase [Yaniella sp.]|uniref:NAD(P)/FAD-dependent oxidoreductase n=1 Tax=Yaniella sp. TaxID=2773929 RepID=UPI00264803ED|nr:FAD-dependent oxidoreductase [Yaniella sp.]MDN6457459.1 FAD-dependent oxidoreductase [Yaniella sp.]MDN6521332.1 FAD-dependent oxidoreductase [Yaniella sp.]MDN6679299.1 FAD-dependent oxidoreductase [Yaniella sp.]